LTPASSSRSAGIVIKVGPPDKRRVTAVTVAFSVILIITSLLMVLLVLLHKGKGGGLSDLFGGGISSSLGSSSVVERNLDRITIVTGVIWFVCIVVLGILDKH
jgi:preprotein translocase subunit SecG